MREKTKKIIEFKRRFKDDFISPENKTFESEKEFQIWLGRKLKRLGFEVFFDKKICDDIQTFKGDKRKPDILVFFNEIFKKTKTEDIVSPFAIEVKFVSGNNTFNVVSNSVLQMKKYHNLKYSTKDWSGRISNIFLVTDSYIFENRVYNWLPADDFYTSGQDFHDGLNWTIVRFIHTISNKSGLIGWDGKYFCIETPNSVFYFLQNGNLGYKPSSWNNYGKGL